MTEPDASQVLTELEAWGWARRWVGPDPYEGLNSALGRIAPGRRGRQLVTQAYKRLPLRPRWPLAAQPHPNAKALGLALSGYSTPAGRRFNGAEEKSESIISGIAKLNLATRGAAWGYPFEVQTRNIRYDRTTPNAIATTFVVGGLLDAHEATGRADVAELAISARPFLLSLYRESPAGPYFSYVPAGSDLIHNANLLVCGALARLHGFDADAGAAEKVGSAAQTTINHQKDDGLWPYGERGNFAWVDSFHTAYVLDGLRRVQTAFPSAAGAAFDRGLDAWRERLLDPDGWARYYPGSRYPLETHCCASAVDILCLAGDRRTAAEVAATAIKELWIEDEGRFGFARTSRGLNGREFMRWTNAPMFRALATLVGSARR